MTSGQCVGLSCWARGGNRRRGPPTRFIFVPIMALSGLWMWKGHLVRRLIWK